MLVATLLLAATTIFGTPHVRSQQVGLPKLTLSQIEGLIVHGVPDSTLGAQIERRGISFAPTPAIRQSLRATGAGPSTLTAIESFNSETPTAKGLSGSSGPMRKQPDLATPPASSQPSTSAPPPASTQWFKPLSGDEGQYVVRISSGRYIAAGKVSFRLYVQPIGGSESESLYLGDSEGEDNEGSFNVWLNGVDSNYIHCAGKGYPCRLFPGMPTYINVEVDRPSGINTFAFALKIAPGGGAWITYDFAQIPVYAEFVAGVAAAGAEGISTVNPSAEQGSGDTSSSNQTSRSSVGAHDSRYPIVPNEEMATRRIAGASPIYPPIAKAAGISGTVVLDAIISESGSVEKVRVISGPSMLQASALDAVRTWQYKPYLINNEPVEVETTVHLTFSLGPR